MNRVQFEASQIMISEAQSNDIYMSVQMRMFSARSNRNGYAVSEAFIDNIVGNAEKYTCLPQCADAQRLRMGSGDKLTHMLEESGFKSEQIGSFFSFAKANDEFGVSLIGEARIPKRDERLCETIQQMYASGRLAFSFEIMATVISEVDGAMVIDAAEGNELIGMAIVSVPAYPEATALRLVAEEQKEDENMDEMTKKLAEAEARLKLAEEKVKDDEEKLKEKEDELTEEKKKREESETSQASAQEQATEKDARIAELEAQVAELAPFKAEAETLKAEKAAAELAAKQQELTAFAEAQGLDPKSETIAAAIQYVDYAALVAEAMKQDKKPETKPTVASYAMTEGMNMNGDYGDLLGKA